MLSVGIICEYNPLHLGHQKQMAQIRSAFGSGTAIVCAMSGNYVQRGAPAIVDKSRRAQAAVLCGADLVLELPVTTSLSSAEGFAAGGVAALAPLCTHLCFGAESADTGSLMAAAQALLSPEFPPRLKAALETGLSFPAARQAALEQLGVPGALLTQPNDILALEYCKAILAQNASLTPFPIRREGSYHAESLDPAHPSATAVRRRMLSGQDWLHAIPEAARPVFASASLHSLAAGERAVLSRLRTLPEAEFEALPYGSEGLWRKFYRACREQPTLEAILTATKSKRYTRSRLDRMALCAFLGISQSLLEAPAPYIRVLAFNDRGRALLRTQRNTGRYCNAGQRMEGPYWALEQRCGDLYGLFCQDAPEPPAAEARRRIFCQP